MTCTNYDRSARVLHFVDVPDAISFLCKMGQIQMMIKVKHRSRSDNSNNKKEEEKKKEKKRSFGRLSAGAF